MIAAEDRALIEILKTIYYGSVALLIIVMSVVGHKSIKENQEDPESEPAKATRPDDTNASGAIGDVPASESFDQMSH